MRNTEGPYFQIAKVKRGCVAIRWREQFLRSLGLSPTRKNFAAGADLLFTLFDREGCAWLAVGLRWLPCRSYTARRRAKASI
jgi:hypothetical protein